jgi:cytochrome c biogenesis protein
MSFLSSVKFGVFLLCVLVVLSMIGMLVIQQNVQGFEAYYATRTPSEKAVFGFLGFFDIYHSWYYNFLLLLLSLNIVLASIDRFPSAWSYIVKPKVDATRGWLLGRDQKTELAAESLDSSAAVERIAATMKAEGYSTRVTSKNGATYVFGEKGKWNRLGAYIVHVALLTLFLGHFVALQTGFDADVSMTPGQVSDEIQLIRINLDKQEKFAVKLPFTITCTDVQQKLINPNGHIDVTNTLDWRTQIKIDDPEYGTTVADVSLNNPYHYRGYRFFQAQTIPVGHARTMKFELAPEDGGTPYTFELARNGSHTLPNGTLVEYDSFQADFVLNGGQPDTKAAEYNNPAAVLNVTPPGGERFKVFAFLNKLPDNAPIGAPKAGFKWRLTEFEKAPMAHILSIKYDPYDGAFIAWYFGGTGLMGALVFVFFYSHRRVWAMVEPRPMGGAEIVLAGDSNRNHLGFGDRFNTLANKVSSELTRDML